ncbi:MAG: alpha/beta hydrolase [Gemmatimonadaceae bacterium]
MSKLKPRLMVPWLCALSACGPSSASESPDAYEAQRGPRVSAETTFIGMRGRYADYRIRISIGPRLSVTGRLLQPTKAAVPRRYPAVLLQNGRELNSRAVEFLPADFGDVVVLSLDYPDEFPYQLNIREILLRSDRLRRASRRVAPMFSLGADYLLARPDVDTSRLVIVATSFAVPFAVQAAAADTRFVNVGLIYGAGNMGDVLAANLTFRPQWMRPAVAWLAMRPFAEFAPERYVSRIAPRPIVMVNGIDDPQMPRRAVQTLYDEAREPKTIIWLRTGHLLPEDSTLVRALVDTTLARLPALRDVAATRRR